MKPEITFDFLPGSSVLIYGAGELGQSIYNKIKHIYTVKCFIDQNVSNIADINIEVRNLDNISEYKDNIVLICVHNANWHCDIAKQLYELGFEKILFLAFSDIYQEETALIMNQRYNLFFEEEYNFLKNIPAYPSIIQRTSEERILRKSSSYVIAYCGKELIYSSNLGNEEYAKSLYSDTPMVADKLYMDLFRFFMYGQGSADSYVKTMKHINNSFDMSDAEFSKSQYLIYQLLEREYAKGIDFISLMPIDVEWNTRGYFNIMDGQHRCAFYILKGMQNIPVRMQKKDYSLWVNNLCMKQVETILLCNHLQPAMRINHPVLSGYNCRYTEYETTLLDIFQQWLYSLKRTFLAVLEISPYQAYLSHNIYRTQKINKISSIVFDEREKEFAYALSTLQHVPENAIEIFTSLHNLDVKKSYTFELGLICNIYDIRELEENLFFINKTITDTLFWQSKSDIEAEKKYIMQNSEFHHYECLSHICFDGKLCEIGVFQKNGNK